MTRLSQAARRLVHATTGAPIEAPAVMVTDRACRACGEPLDPSATTSFCCVGCLVVDIERVVS